MGMDNNESLYREFAGDLAMTVYLIRIKDKPFGFKIVAVCALTEGEALQYVDQFYGTQPDITKPNWRRIEHRCTAIRGCAATYDYEE